MTKLTYSKALEIAIETLADNKEVAEKLKALKTSVEKKNGADRKPTATQKANADLKVKILGAMEVDKAYTITEMMKEFDFLAELSNQRVSAIVRQMKEEGLVTREEVKRKAYFTKVVA